MVHIVEDGKLGDATLWHQSYPTPAAGWVEGVYTPRIAERAAYDEPPQGAHGLSMSGSAALEESEAVGGDANTIARCTYFAGTQLVATVPERTYRLSCTVASAETKPRRWCVVVNDQRMAQFDLAAGATASVSCRAVLTSRTFTFMLVSMGAYDDGAADEAAIELIDLALDDVPAPADHTDNPAIWIAADSTVQTYFDRERPQSGWGEWLAWHLYADHTYQSEHDDGGCTVQAMRYRGDGPTIHNRALGARSARSYIAEGRLAALFAGVCPGDFVITQFGLNDASSSRPMRYVPVEDYASWLARYVEGALDRGAHPVLVTAPPQYAAPGSQTEHSAFDDYAEATRAYARDAGVPLIDLRREMTAFLDTLPAENRAVCYLRAPAHQWASHPDGIADTVHLSTYGAFVCAGIVAHGLAALNPAFRVAPDERPALTVPADVQVRGITGIIGLEAEVRWSPVAGADYYTVEKRSAETGRVYDRWVTTQPRVRDLPLPGQSRHVAYVIRAWHGAEPSEPARMALTLPASDDRVPMVSARPAAPGGGA